MLVENIAVLTSGTDAPGMNAAIRAVVRTAISNNVRIWGVIDGYRGLVDDNMEEMTSVTVSDIIQRGGTFLGTSFCKRFYTTEGRKQAYDNLKNTISMHLSLLVVMVVYVAQKNLKEKQVFL